MLKARDRERGFTLVEIAIALAVLVILVRLGAPSFADWLQNLQTRAATEAVLNGLQAARAEAVRRNTQVRFQFVSDLTASCALSPTSLNWVVSVGDPSAKCNQSIDAPTPGPVIQSRAAQEASPNATLAITPPGTVTTITFNALGGVVPQNADGSLPITQVDLSNPMVTGPAARPLRVVITAGGSIRMCDLAVASPDPRACP